MENANCLNCEHPFNEGGHFCPVCGQKKATRRISFRQLGYDFLQTIINTEKGVLRLFRGLATRPGATAADYVEGKRKTYLNPFTFLAICVAFMVLVNTWLAPFRTDNWNDPALKASVENLGLSEQRIAAVQQLVNKYQNWAIVLVTPYFAAGLWIFFRKRKRNAAEIMVAYVLFAAFSFVLATCLLTPWLSAYRDTAAYNFLFMATFVLEGMYIAWGFTSFFGYRSFGGYIKILAALALVGLIGTILLFMAIFLYARLG
jgi:hypothetical protein